MKPVTNWIARSKRHNSLHKLLFIQETAFILLLLITGLLGGVSAYFWQQSSSESVRLNQLHYTTEQIRSVLFIQIDTAVRARLLKDESALQLYGQYSGEIDKKFNKLHSNSKTREEALAIQELHVSYRTIQNDMNIAFSGPDPAPEGRMRMLNPIFARSAIADFERKYSNLKELLVKQHEALDDRLETWSRYAPLIIAAPLIPALLLVIYARAVFRRDFLKPISAIIDAAHFIRGGRLKAELPERGVEEVKNLAGAINQMANDLQSSQKALVESEKQAALGALVPVVAHNIRNPLASIRATAQILDTVEDQDELETNKSAIIDTIDRLNRWVSSLVSYLHPLKPSYRPVYASAMVKASTALLKPKIEEKSLKIKEIGWEHDLRLNADPDLMEQAICALLANAIEASPAEATLIFEFSVNRAEFELSIQDQGAGLPFEPEPKQLTPGPSTKSFGTGLGIPIAFKICQQHGWKLNFSPAEATGTRVTITAPIADIQ